MSSLRCLLATVASLTLSGCLDQSMMAGAQDMEPSSDQPSHAGGPPAGGPDGGTTAPLDGSSGNPPDLGESASCGTVNCGLHQHCEAKLCVCDEGFALQGGVCMASPVGDPATHSQADVCSKYTTSAMGVDNFFTKTAATCDPGSVSADGITDAVERINYYRWLVGLAPVGADASANNLAQKCALVSAWNPVGQQAHFPSPSAECYTAEGAAGAGSSNIAWGSGSPVGAIDQWIQDWGNETTLGHRRWIFNPPLDPVGFGMYVGGDAGYGSAACLQVFNQSGTGPRPDFVAFPPPGYVPADLTQFTWSFSADWDFSSPTVTVTRLSDNAPLAVNMLPLNNPGFGNYPNATSWTPNGWTPTAGQIYRVSITAGSKSATYDVKPVGCP